MFHNQLIRDGFGRRYKLHLLGDGPTPKHLKPKSFYDETFTRSFLDNMSVSESYWRQLSYQLVGSLPYTANPRDYLDVIARLLIQGRIQLFEINESNTKQYPVEKCSFKQSDGRIYRLISPTEKLIDPTKKTKKFHSRKEAVEFVKKMSPEQESIRDIAREFKLSLPFNSQSDEQEILYASVGDMIFDERVLIVSEEPSKPPVSEPEYEYVYIKKTSLGPEKIFKNENASHIFSIAFLDGTDDIELTRTGKQFVNLPRADKWADATNVLNKDRLTNTPRFKVRFDQPGVHAFKVKFKPENSNTEFSEDEKSRNDKYTYFEEEKSYTTNADGTLIVEDDFFITVAGKDKYQLVAEDNERNKVKTEKIEVYRIIYIQQLPMATLSSVASSISTTISEFKKHNIVLEDLGSAEVPHMPNIGSAGDVARFKANARATYAASSAQNKTPYVLAVAYTDQLAVKNTGVEIESEKVDVGPGKAKVTMPMAARGLSSPAVSKRALWQEIVPGESWFVSASYLPDGGTAPLDLVTIPEADCEAIEDPRFSNEHNCKDVKVTVTGLPSGAGIITLTVNLVDRMRGGLASSGNTAIVCTRAWWNDKSSASQNRIMIHEFGHMMGMVPDDSVRGHTGPDTSAHHYFGRGHIGHHCHKGLTLRTTFATGDNSAAACVMFGATTNNSAFCSSCKPAVRKADLSNGWSSF